MHMSGLSFVKLGGLAVTIGGLAYLLYEEHSQRLASEAKLEAKLLKEHSRRLASQAKLEAKLLKEHRRRLASQAKLKKLRDKINDVVPKELATVFGEFPASFLKISVEYIAIDEVYEAIHKPCDDSQATQYVKLFLKQCLDQTPVERVEDCKAESQNYVTRHDIPGLTSESAIITRLYILTTDATYGNSTSIEAACISNESKGYVRWVDVYKVNPDGSKVVASKKDESKKDESKKEKLKDEVKTQLKNDESNNEPRKDDSTQGDYGLKAVYHIVIQHSRAKDVTLIGRLGSKFGPWGARSTIELHDITFSRFFRNFQKIPLGWDQWKSFYETIYSDEIKNRITNRKFSLFGEEFVHRKSPKLGHKLLSEFPTETVDNLSERMSQLTDNETLPLTESNLPTLSSIAQAVSDVDIDEEFADEEL